MEKTTLSELIVIGVGTRGEKLRSKLKRNVRGYHVFPFETRKKLLIGARNISLKRFYR